MPKPVSTGFQTHIQSVSRADPELILLEITHQDLAQPIRVVNDTQDLTSGGYLFVAAPFQFTLPDEREGQAPRAQLIFSNVGREMMAWLESSNGGRGAMCRVRVVRRSLPNNIELDFTVGLLNISADMAVVSADLGYDSLMDRSATLLRYDPVVAPGLF